MLAVRVMDYGGQWFVLCHLAIETEQATRAENLLHMSRTFARYERVLLAIIIISSVIVIAATVWKTSTMADAFRWGSVAAYILIVIVLFIIFVCGVEWRKSGRPDVAGADVLVWRSGADWETAERVASDWTARAVTTGWEPAHVVAGHASCAEGKPWRWDPEASGVWAHDSRQTAYLRCVMDVEGEILPGCMLAFWPARLEVYVNGRPLPERGIYPYPGPRQDVTQYLRRGTNVIAVKATDASPVPGVYASLQVVTADSADAATVMNREVYRRQVRRWILTAGATVLAAASVYGLSRIVKTWRPRPLHTLRRWVCSDTLWLFVCLWATLGAFANTYNMSCFSMQHLGVSAIADRGQFYMEEGLQCPNVDMMVGRDGHLYALKAPGIFVLDAVGYLPLRWLAGLRYEYDFVTGVCVAFLTTALLTAVAAAMLYRVVSEISKSRMGGIVVALAYAFGTVALPYSGFLHHDQSSAALLLIAFCLMFTATRRECEAWWRALLAGMALGLALFVSYSGFVTALCITGYMMSSGKGRQIAAFLSGLCLGVMPLAVMNTAFFGAPWVTSYGASGDIAAKVSINWQQIWDRFWFHFGSPITGVFYHSPILLLGCVGLGLFPRGYRREQWALIAIVVLGYVDVFVTGTWGHAQVGNRLILTFVWAMGAGVAAYWVKREQHPLSRVSLQVVCVMFLMVSAVFCGLMALGTTMYFDVRVWPAWYVNARTLMGPPFPEGFPHYNIKGHGRPLLPVLIWVAPLALGMFVWRARSESGKC